MLEGTPSLTSLCTVVVELGCTHPPTTSKSTSIPLNSWNPIGRLASRKRWRSHRWWTPSCMSQYRRPLPWPIVAGKSTSTNCCQKRNYWETTGRTDEDECRWVPHPKECYSAATQYPLSTDLWRCNGPEISPHVCSQWKRDAQELASHLEAPLLSRNQEATKSNT